MEATMSSSTTSDRALNTSCVLRRNVATQPYGRCSVCSLRLSQCHAWQSSGYSFGVVVLAFASVLVPAGLPQALVVAGLLALVVAQGMQNHKKTDDLIHGQHNLLKLTRQLEAQRAVIEAHNKTLSHEVDRRTAELRETNVKLAATNLELIELEHLRTAALSTTSHDLRTPLTAVLGAAQNLRDGIAGELAPAQEEYVGIIEAESKRLIGVVNEVLEYTRLESGRVSLARAEVDMRALLDEVAAVMRPLAATHAIALEVEGEAASVQGDFDKLRRALLNLAENAIKYSNAGGTVRLSARPADGMTAISVQDDGIGIAREDQGKLFERFFRAANGKDRPGTGLGLAIARNIARLHGGDITVTSALERGSTFTLHLPANAVAQGV